MINIHAKAKLVMRREGDEIKQGQIHGWAGAIFEVMGAFGQEQ